MWDFSVCPSIAIGLVAAIVSVGVVVELGLVESLVLAALLQAPSVNNPALVTAIIPEVNSFIFALSIASVDVSSIEKDDENQMKSRLH
jgi:hypothetical protein